MYSDVPTTCFGRFLTGHHQVGIHCQRNYMPTISIDISVSVSTDIQCQSNQGKVTYVPGTE